MKSFRLMAMMAGLLSLFALASCSKEKKDADPYVKIDGQTSASYDLTKEKKDVTVKIYSNREWGVRMSDAAAEWVSVSPKSGKAAEDGVTVTVSVLENKAGNRTATVEFYAGTATATLTLNQEGSNGDSDEDKPEVIEYTDATIAEIIASPVPGNYRIQNGQVVNVPSKNIVIINDGTGDLYVYKTGHGLAEGDVATFSGEVKLYYDTVLELDSPTIEKTGTKEVVRPDATVWSSADIDAYYGSSLVTVKYVTIDGTLVKSGNYYKLEISGTSSCEYINLYKSDDKDITEFEGKAVKLTGYAYNVNTSQKNVTVSLVDIAIDPASEYVTVSPASLNWNTDDRSAKTVTVDASGSFTVTADEGSFPDGNVWATFTVEGNTVTITPDASTAGITDKKLYGKFIVTSGSKTTAIDVAVGPDTTHPFTSNVTWDWVQSAIDENAIINRKTDVRVVKIGTDSAVGSFTVTIPAGTKKLGFYALAWSGKACAIAIAGTGSTEDLTVDLSANSGVNDNRYPYTIATNDAEAYHEVEILDASATKLTISSTDADKARAIFWGINSYSE